MKVTLTRQISNIGTNPHGEIGSPRIPHPKKPRKFKVNKLPKWLRLERRRTIRQLRSDGQNAIRIANEWVADVLEEQYQRKHSRAK